ncbi:calcium/sodium antiporter [Candidatus Gracilibacteria bacterium]|nr:calcium/sodium antiporter [Candidatus Gracilibacteria bacterium]
MPFLPILLLLFGLGVLIVGAEWLVRGSASVARKSGISPLVIGLTVVAFGTSMPELIVNVIAAFQGSVDIGLGNILGSNISNILLILGVSACIVPLQARSSTIRKEIPLAILSMGLLWIVANDIFFDGANHNLLSRTDGLSLMLLFSIFLYATLTAPKETHHNSKVKQYSSLVSVLFILAGVGGLFWGGKLLVDNATIIAKLFGLSEAFIGLTIIAIGTSLPELATSVAATLKNEHDIAIGNIVGSNIFNVLWVLGLTSSILPLPISENINTDILITVIISLLLWGTLIVGKKKIPRWAGVLFLTLYVTYIVYLIFRG